MRRALFFIVACLFAATSFASIQRASMLDRASERPSAFVAPLPETRVWASDVLAPFERQPASALTRALHQAYGDSSTTSASGLRCFLSVDPVLDLKAALKQPQRWNRYAYVGNNPINRIDPDGRCDTCLDFQLGREQAAVARGEMTLQEYNDRNTARGVGALIGAAPWAIVAAVDAGVSIYEGFQTWRAVRAGQAIASTATGAYEAAEKGGRHAGYLANMASRPINQIANAINGYGKVIQQHLQWLANPTLKVADWASKTSAEQQIIRQKWLDDVARNKQLQDVMQGLFNRLMQ